MRGSNISRNTRRPLTQQLIECLAKLGDDWGGARPQDDDVTFVVLKRKGV